MNLAEFPISLLTDRVPRGRKTIEFKDPFFDEATGRVITRKLIITASDKFGLPTAKDDEVIVGLLQLTKEANKFTDRTVAFSRSELIERLVWPDTGQSYRRIMESFDRWTSVYLSYEKAWWDHEHKSWVDEKFHIIDRVSLYDRDRQLKQGSLKLSSFTWSDVLFRSFQSGYLKRIDFDFYISLVHPTAKRMYRFLDKRFYLKRRWEFDLKEFAWDHIGLSRGYADSGKIKEKLQPALDELEERGFLEAMTREERYAKLGRSNWTVIVAQKARERVKDGKSQELTSPEILSDLAIRGVTPSTATELVAAFSAADIRQKIEVFDWLIEKKDKRVSKSPAGYLVESIRNDYADPKGFELKAVRAKREEAKREEARRAAESKREERRRSDRADAVQKRIAAYWEGLSPAEREELDATALREADPARVADFRDHEARGYSWAKTTFRMSVREPYIKRLLKLDDEDGQANTPV